MCSKLELIATQGPRLSFSWIPPHHPYHISRVSQKDLTLYFILRTALSTQMIMSLDIPRDSYERRPECRRDHCLPHWWCMWSLNSEAHCAQNVIGRLTLLPSFRVFQNQFKEPDPGKGAIWSQDSPNPSTHHYPEWRLNGGRNEVSAFSNKSSYLQCEC